jgi:hypothetical protein
MRFMSNEPEKTAGDEAKSEAITSGDHSPAANASHSGTGDIRIDQSTHHHQSSAGVSRYQGERILTKSPAELAGYYESHTSLQADRLIAAFIGKPLVIRGAVQNVNALLDGASVLLRDENRLWMSVDFSTEWKDRLSELNRDDEVQIVGRIKEISASTVDLSEGELVEGEIVL